MDPSDVRERWAERSGEYSPEYYADYGPTETSEYIRAILDTFASADPAILELGCSAGRHLAHLQEHGYENLYGVEVNDDALDAMKDAYPDLAADGTFYLDAIEDVVPAIEEGRFDVVYSVETLELIHPENDWVLEEVSRITDDLLLTVENEGETTDSGSSDPSVEYIDGFPLYHREWKQIFCDLGFDEILTMPAEMDTLRAFRSSS